MDSEIHLTIILQEVRKNLGMLHFLELFRAEKTQKLTFAYEGTVGCLN